MSHPRTELILYLEAELSPLRRERKRRGEEESCPTGRLSCARYHLVAVNPLRIVSDKHLDEGALAPEHERLLEETADVL